MTEFELLTAFNLHFQRLKIPSPFAYLACFAVATLSAFLAVCLSAAKSFSTNVNARNNFKFMVGLAPQALNSISCKAASHILGFPVFLASPMEMPDWIALFYFGLVPIHLVGGFGSFRGTKGTEAAWGQAIALFVLIALTFFMCRSSKRSARMKLAFLLVGYPIVIIASNLAPAFIFRMTGSFSQP